MFCHNMGRNLVLQVQALNVVIVTVVCITQSTQHLPHMVLVVPNGTGLGATDVTTLDDPIDLPCGRQVRNRLVKVSINININDIDLVNF